MLSLPRIAVISAVLGLVLIIMLFMSMQSVSRELIDVSSVDVDSVRVYSDTLVVNYFIEIYFDVRSDAGEVRVVNIYVEVYVVSGDTRVPIGSFSRGGLTWRPGKNRVAYNATAALPEHYVRALRAIRDEGSAVYIEADIDIVYEVGGQRIENRFVENSLPRPAASLIRFYESS